MITILSMCLFSPLDRFQFFPLRKISHDLVKRTLRLLNSFHGFFMLRCELDQRVFMVDSFPIDHAGLQLVQNSVAEFLLNVPYRGSSNICSPV